jgi:hypothetical protein
MIRNVSFFVQHGLKQAREEERLRRATLNGRGFAAARDDFRTPRR